MCVDNSIRWIDICLGQSNARGGANASGGGWPENENVLVWNRNFDELGIIGTGASPLCHERRGREPFSDTGSNNFGVHAVDWLQRRVGGKSVYLLHAVGGELIDSFLPGGRIWTSLVANMAVLTTLYPNAILRSVMLHHGESAQLESNSWYTGKLQQLLANLRGQPWFPPGTPIVLGQLYAGRSSSARHWSQNQALANMPLLDVNVGLVASHGLDVVDEGLTDHVGAPYGIHFTGEDLVTLGRRYGAAVHGMIDGTHNPAKFSLRERMGGGRCDNPEMIVVPAAGAVTLTIDELLLEPVIKCMGQADVTLPDISSPALSSWVRNYSWRFSIFRNGATGDVRLHTGNAHTIAIESAASASSVSIADRNLRNFLYTRDSRWRC